MEITPIPVGPPAWAPPPVILPRPDTFPATIIVIVVVLSAVLLIALGTAVSAVGTVLAAAAAAAGYLIRQMRGETTREEANRG